MHLLKCELELIKRAAQSIRAAPFLSLIGKINLIPGTKDITISLAIATSDTGGDMVLAADEEPGEVAYKKVIQYQ